MAVGKTLIIDAVKDATYDALHDALKNRTVKIYQLNNLDPPQVRLIFGKVSDNYIAQAQARLDQLGVTYQIFVEVEEGDIPQRRIRDAM